ncbi:MAG: SAM-dependent methyltransferase [Actinobacteria bacterium]|nr:SAM-dependent methyltransferase [Actinomycetota bacterium]
MGKPDRGAVPYYAITVLLFPLSLIGYVLWVAAALSRTKRSGVSMTAQGPLSTRWAMHRFGVRSDPAADRIMPILPGVPRLASRLVSTPAELAHRLTGFVPKTFRYPFEGAVPPQSEAAARVTFFDRVVDEELPAIDQLVILGAGFDTRPYRLPADTPVRSFEVEMPATLAIKQQVLTEAAIDTRGVTFVPADFGRDDWLARLVDAGFDSHRPALFLWEGVIIYLEPDAVRETLRKVASCAPGSLIAFDYYTSMSLESDAAFWRMARSTTARAGEPLRFGVDATPPVTERLTELLAGCGLVQRENQVHGTESATERAWGGFAVAAVA